MYLLKKIIFEKELWDSWWEKWVSRVMEESLLVPFRSTSKYMEKDKNNFVIEDKVISIPGYPDQTWLQRVFITVFVNSKDLLKSKSRKRIETESHQKSNPLLWCPLICLNYFIYRLTVTVRLIRRPRSFTQWSEILFFSNKKVYIIVM